jgi:hypothetical protein
MSVTMPCPHCGKHNSVPSHALGHVVQCASCNKTFLAESPTERNGDAPSATDQFPEVRDRDHPRHDKDADALATPSIQTEPSPLEAAHLITRLLRRWINPEWRRIPVSLSFWLMVPLFFLPWINVSCANYRLATQTGLQACIGTATASPRLQKLRKDQFNRRNNFQAPMPLLQVEHTNKAYLVWAFGFFGISACLIGLLCIPTVLFRFPAVAAVANLLGLALVATCGLLLIVQMSIAFPIEREITEARKADEARRHPLLNDPFRREEPMVSDVVYDVEASYSAWFWILFTYTLLAIPLLFIELTISGVAVYRWVRYGRVVSADG